MNVRARINRLEANCQAMPTVFDRAREVAHCRELLANGYDGALRDALTRFIAADGDMTRLSEHDLKLIAETEAS